jgi:hypothetical protein
MGNTTSRQNSFAMPGHVSEWFGKGSLIGFNTTHPLATYGSKLLLAPPKMMNSDSGI